MTTKLQCCLCLLFARPRSAPAYLSASCAGHRLVLQPSPSFREDVHSSGSKAGHTSGLTTFDVSQTSKRVQEDLVGNRQLLHAAGEPRQNRQSHHALLLRGPNSTSVWSKPFNCPLLTSLARRRTLGTSGSHQTEAIDIAHLSQIPSLE